MDGPSGTQSLARSIKLLRMLAKRGEIGWRLSDLAAACSLDNGEERFVTLGPLGDSLVVIVTAETQDHIRVISMRKADRHEQVLYRENLI